MAYLPLFLKLQHQPALLVGGGIVAYRKARALLRAKADIHICSAHFSNDLKALAKDNDHITLMHQTSFNTEMLSAFRVVIAATNDSTINHDVAMKAQKINIPVNVVDEPDHSTFLMPAIIDRSPLLIAISSAGKAPVLARKIRQQIEQLVPDGMGRVVELAGQLRDKVKNAGLKNQRYFWERLFSGFFTRHILRGHERQAYQVADQLLQGEEPDTGMVYLTGAGPGDPELLTIKALNVLQKADIILYDQLVSMPVLDKARRDAMFIPVGKSAGKKSITQAQINQNMRAYAHKGNIVCRLKGGDPFIFGRGGEEIAYLQSCGIRYEIVPGITAAMGCAASAGMPLTHRDFAQTIRLTSAKSKHGHITSPEGDKTSETLAIYMGLTSAEQLQNNLIENGYALDTPIAIIAHGTTLQQSNLVGQLGELVELVKTYNVHSPAMIYIGNVVDLMPLTCRSQRINAQPWAETSARISQPQSHETLTE